MWFLSGTKWPPVLTVFIVRVFLLPSQAAAHVCLNGCPNSQCGTWNTPSGSLGPSSANDVWEALAERVFRESVQPSADIRNLQTCGKDSVDYLISRTPNQQCNSCQGRSPLLDSPGALLRQPSLSASTPVSLPRRPEVCDSNGNYRPEVSPSGCGTLYKTQKFDRCVDDSLRSTDSLCGGNGLRSSCSSPGFVDGDSCCSSCRNAVLGSKYPTLGSDVSYPSLRSSNFGQPNELSPKNPFYHPETQNRLFHRDFVNGDLRSSSYQSGPSSVDLGPNSFYPTPETPVTLPAYVTGLQPTPTLPTFEPLPVPRPVPAPGFSALEPNVNNGICPALQNDLQRVAFGDLYNPKYWSAPYSPAYNNLWNPTASTEVSSKLPATLPSPLIDRSSLLRPTPALGDYRATLSPSWLWDQALPAPRPLGFVVLRGGERVSVRYYYLILDHYLRKGWRDVTFQNGFPLHCVSFAQFESLIRQKSSKETLFYVAPNFIVSGQTYCDVIKSLSDPDVLLELPGGSRCPLKDLNSLPDCDTWRRLLFPINFLQDPISRFLAPVFYADASTVNIRAPITRPVLRPFGFVVLSHGERVSVQCYYLIIDHYLRKGWQDVSFVDGSELHCVSFAQFESIVRRRSVQDCLLSVGPNVVVSGQTYCDVIRSLSDCDVLLELPSGRRCPLKDLNSLPDCDTWLQLLFPQTLFQDPIARYLVSVLGSGGSTIGIVKTGPNVPSNLRQLGFVVLRGGVRVPIRYYYLILDHYVRKGWQDVTTLNGGHLRCSSFAQFESIVCLRNIQETLFSLAPNVVVSGQMYCDVIKSVSDPDVMLELLGGRRCLLKDLNSLPDCDLWRGLLFPQNLAQDPTIASYLAPILFPDGSAGALAASVRGPTSSASAGLYNSQSLLTSGRGNPVLDRGIVLAGKPLMGFDSGSACDGSTSNVKQDSCPTCSILATKKDATTEPNGKGDCACRNGSECPQCSPKQLPTPVNDSGCQTCLKQSCY